MKAIAVIDTNVLVSGLLSRHDDSATAVVLSRLITGDIQLIYSKAILSEYVSVLGRKKFGFSHDKLSVLFAFIKKYGKKRRRGISCNGEYPSFS